MIIYGRVGQLTGLGDARRGTWGHQVWDAGTCGTGTRGRQIQGRRGRGMWMIIAKGGGKCDISVLFMVNIRLHLSKPHWTPYDVYTKYFFIILNLFGIECCYLRKFWRPQPTLPCFGLQYSFSKKTRTTVSLSSMQGSSPSLRFVNRHGGTLRRAGWVAFTKVTDIAFISDFCNNYSHPASPASLYLKSPRPRPTRPILDVLKSPSPKSPHTRPLVPVPLLYTAQNDNIWARWPAKPSSPLLSFNMLTNVLYR